MIIKNLSPLQGQHCETTATGTLVKHLGIDLSEPMLFGLGQGLGFIYWDMPKLMDFPFLGGRIRQTGLTRNLCRNLKLSLDIRETSSIKTAWQNVREKIDLGSPVGLQLDCHHLDYFTNKIHFAGHFVAMYGYDDMHAYLVDTKQQGTFVKAGLKNLELARNEKGPMSAKNLSYTIDRNKEQVDPGEIIPAAIRNNALDFLNPAITNLGWKGIAKSGKMIRKWFDRSKDGSQYELAAMLMESGGTGGALFRNIYRDFLRESLEVVPARELESGYEIYARMAQLWNEVADRIKRAGRTLDQKYLDEAAGILAEISEGERKAMEILCRIRQTNRKAEVN